MGGGSVERECTRDRQCRHCGLWYESPGLQNHESHCDYRDVEYLVVPIEDEFTLSRIESADGSGVKSFNL